jgi:hypothetical protein
MQTGRGGDEPALGLVQTSLVRLFDQRGSALQACLDGTLKFVPSSCGGSSSTGGGSASVWVLAATPGRHAHCRYTLQNAAAGKFLAAPNGQLTCSFAPASLQLFMDLDRREWQDWGWLRAVDTHPPPVKDCSDRSLPAGCSPYLLRCVASSPFLALQVWCCVCRAGPACRPAPAARQWLGVCRWALTGLPSCFAWRRLACRPTACRPGPCAPRCAASRLAVPTCQPAVAH